MSRSTLPLSAVVIAKNEEKNIRRCVDALAWCNDVVVIDDESNDKTVSLAIASGARVITHRFESFARQRNWALQHADLRNEWVLMLDADEVVTPELRDDIERSISAVEEDVVGFRMCRKTMFHGTWLRFSDDFPVWIVRLVRRNRFSFEDSGHGEVPIPHVNGKLGTVRTPFLHFPFSKGLVDWIDRHNRYSSREAEKELLENLPVRWRTIFGFDRGGRRQTLRSLSRRLPCRSVLRFAYQYIWKFGFLEGFAGLTFSWLMAVYEGLIVLKRRELERQRKEGDL